MKKIITVFLIAIVLSILTSMQLFAQDSETKYSGGLQFNGLLPATEFKSDNGLKGAFLIRHLSRFQFSDMISSELGIGYGRLAGLDFDKNYWMTELIPIDLRLLLKPFGEEAPYLYAGIGALQYKVRNLPISVSPKSVNQDDWTGIIPAGIGITKKLNETVSLEITGGVTYSLTDNLNYYRAGEPTDAYYSLGLGIIFTSSDDDKDFDNDGLTNGQEKALGTDPKNPDTDNDGLKDGEEVNKFKTNPLSADSDNDGLKDGEEVNRYKTDPLNPDTDNDGLKDGEEVTKYKTDPLKADTDGGTVNDGKEIAGGTNPLNPNDDVPKKEEIKVEVGKSIVLEGIVFKTGSAKISEESADILEKAYNTLEQNPEIEVEIQGHTDNVGKSAYNKTLSQKRADAVKKFLVEKGINESRITTKGYGFDKPLVPNTTPENRQMNRRIEFFRTK